MIRTYGIEGMQQKIRDHIAAGQWLKEEILKTPGIELMAPVPFNLACFRFHPQGMDDNMALDKYNEKMLEKINSSGSIFLTQTRLNGRYVIRFVAGQTHATLETVQKGWRSVVDISLNNSTPM